jgi:hypothetical protein
MIVAEKMKELVRMAREVEDVGVGGGEGATSGEKMRESNRSVFNVSKLGTCFSMTIMLFSWVVHCAVVQCKRV